MHVQFFSHRSGDGCMVDGSMVTTAEWLGHCVSFSTSSPFAVYFSWQKNLPRDKKCKDNLKLTEIDGLKCWTVRHWRCLHSKNNTDQKKRTSLTSVKLLQCNTELIPDSKHRTNAANVLHREWTDTPVCQWVNCYQVSQAQTTHSRERRKTFSNSNKTVAVPCT